MHRQVAVELQVFDRGLARLESVDLGAQVGNVLDLKLHAADLGAQQAVSGQLDLVQLLNAAVPQPDDHRPSRCRQTDTAEELALALTAPGFPVRQQVDPDHGKNLLIARPQAVR